MVLRRVGWMDEVDEDKDVGLAPWSQPDLGPDGRQQVVLKLSS